MAVASIRPKSAERMEEILASAAKIFFAKGYHATTIEDVAGDVGMLKGSLYYYINSKEDLLYQLLVDSIEKCDANIVERIAGASGPAEKLRRALEAQIEYIMTHRVRVGLLLHEFDTLSGRRQQRVREVMRRYQERFVEIVKEGQAESRFVAGDPWLMVNAMLGMCNWIYRWHSVETHGPERETPELATVQKTFVGILLHGVINK